MTHGTNLTCAALAALLPWASPAAAQEHLAPDPGLPFMWIGVALVGLAVAAVTVAVTVRSQRREALLSAALTTVPQPRQIVGRGGQVLLANPACEAEYGTSERALPDLLAEDTQGDEEAHDALMRLAANARNGIAGQSEIRIPARHRPGNGPAEFVNGEDSWRHVAAYPLAGRPGTVLWLVDDITAERQMEQIIQEEQARFIDLLEHAPVGFYSVDGEGCFLFVNQTLSEWLGMSPDELVSGTYHLHDVIAQPLSATTPPYDPFDRDSSADQQEVSLRGIGGLAFTALINQDEVTGEDGKTLRTRSVVRNLTRERAVEEALEHSERRFKRFFEEAPIGIALLDPDGRVTESNGRFRMLVERRREEIVGKRLVEIIAGESRLAVEVAIERAMAGKVAGDGGASIEVRFARENEVVCALYVNRLEGVEGAPVGFITHFIDTTEQKKLEVQFAQAQKMQAVGQLAGGMAHDFNNLLTAMIGFSDLLLLRHRPGDQSFADIMQIKQNANRAANLVRQLLAFSRQQTLQPKVLNLTDVLAELKHLLRRLIGESIELKVIHGRDIAPIKVDQGQLEQVIINLAVNARDAMPEGGVLTIKTSNADLDRPTKRGSETIPRGSYALIEVTDTGCGIPEEHMDRIFEPFFTTKEIGAGTGLGLSTVYGIVAQTGGLMAVESEVGKGTAFAIFLPQHSGDDVGQQEAEPADRVDTTGRGTVLLVEDEEAVRAFSARVLRTKGYNVLEARSGEVALQLLREHKDPVDLLITDVVMPRVDGPTLVREVRGERPTMKVIYISGYTDGGSSLNLDQEVNVHFLPKPFTLNQLAGKVKEVMREAGA